jgi:hypothetical protein
VVPGSARCDFPASLAGGVWLERCIPQPWKTLNSVLERHEVLHHLPPSTGSRFRSSPDGQPEPERSTEDTQPDAGSTEVQRLLRERGGRSTIWDLMCGLATAVAGHRVRLLISRHHIAAGRMVERSCSANSRSCTTASSKAEPLRWLHCRTSMRTSRSNRGSGFATRSTRSSSPTGKRPCTRWRRFSKSPPTTRDRRG